ncbi:pyrroline-5-carboxylate reductase [Synechococcus sp. Lug-A]|uniref:pyrroline-5-carboxylate reductase family protein n=1 Tax=Synechococcus sp. Lug-A TaxID=2823740 RepID=UPI0020CDB4D9|nr:pyrroline-5-carboxylate reductase [Synechococcus sp. Lug-A]MCP9846374.1 pyrroline-5-carboxylate reductase [Synechococcus sp. Lug-A]
MTEHAGASEPLLSGLGIIGLGQMAQALLLPLLEQGDVRPAAVRAVVASPASAERLQQQLQVAVCAAADGQAAAAWQAPVVLLAVKPQQLAAAATAAADAAAAVRAAHSRSGASAAASATPPASGSAAFASPAAPSEHGDASPAASPAASSAHSDESPLLISVLAGVSLARLQASFPGWRVVRAVPNTPCLVRAGITGLAWGEQLSDGQRHCVRQLFGRVGQVLELPEPQLDGLLAVASSGPALMAVVIEALADGGVAAGLPRALAQELALAMTGGTVALLQQKGLHPGQLKDMVSSPAGTTITALRQLERGSVRSALIEAVLAAAERSRALG